MHMVGKKIAGIVRLDFEVSYKVSHREGPTHSRALNELRRCDLNCSLRV